MLRNEANLAEYENHQMQSMALEQQSKERLMAAQVFITAASDGAVGTIRQILATEGNDPDVKDSSNRTALSYASTVEVVELLLATGKVDPESRDFDGCTPLGHAAADGRDEVVTRLIATGRVYPDSPSHFGKTPLFTAVLFERSETIRILLETGEVDPYYRAFDGQSPLDVAVKLASEGKAEILDILRRYGF